MKNRIVLTRTFTIVTARLVDIFLFTTLFFSVSFHEALAQSAPDLGSADSFAVMGGSAVFLIDSTIEGDVGVATGGAVSVIPPSTVSGTIYDGSLAPYADDAYTDFQNAYDELSFMECDTTLLTGNLAGLVLPPGVYCVDAASTTTGGSLTLDGSSADTWIFKIGTLGTGDLTVTNFSVVMSSGETCNSNVYWSVAEAATLTDSFFIGSILAGSDIAITRGNLDGQALAGGSGTIIVPTVAVTRSAMPSGAVITTDAHVSICDISSPPPDLYPAIKVTGGGQIPVPDPDSSDPTATGEGRADFGFNAIPEKNGGAKGQFNYVNHVTGLHVEGLVTSIQVIAINIDGLPKTVQFSGVWEGGSFIVTVEDHGEPAIDDEFGITVTSATGDPSEVRSQRGISRGDVQFHK
jgi:hypothetical protein